MSGYSSSTTSNDPTSVDVGDGGGGGGIIRKTDPLNLMSVIKIKPTKINKSFSNTGAKKNTGMAAAAAPPPPPPPSSSNFIASNLPPMIQASSETTSFNSPTDTLMGEYSPISSAFDHQTSSTTGMDDGEDMEPVTNFSNNMPPKVVLGRVTIDIQINSMSSYEWLCETLGAPKTSSSSSSTYQTSAKSSRRQPAPPPPPPPPPVHQDVVEEEDRELTMKIVPVLFNLGVNEMQSIANVVGTTEMQTEINRTGLKKLQQYFTQCQSAQQKLNAKVNTHHKNMVPVESSSNVVVGGGGGGGVHSGSSMNSRKVRFFTDETKIPLLLNSLEFLVEAVAKEKGKIVDLLLVSSFAARLLNGARTTSCKSAKDRTSVFHTLEVARLAERMGWLERFAK
jgi:hypothetical protein